nr:unnamed protein product [Callosobruchus analis]
MSSASSSRRSCVNQPDVFCYICGEYMFQQNRRAITEFVKQAYLAYFGVKLDFLMFGDTLPEFLMLDFRDILSLTTVGISDSSSPEEFTIEYSKMDLVGSGGELPNELLRFLLTEFLPGGENKF